MLKIGVVFGGISVEHEISLISGLQVLKNLDTSKYKAVPIYIDKKGKWFSGPFLDNLDFFKDPGLFDRNAVPVSMNADADDNTLYRTKKSFFQKTEFESIDMIFPVLHGGAGENGSLQGFFSMKNIPLISNDVFSSSLSMSKSKTKVFLKDTGIDLLNFKVVSKSEWMKDNDRVQQEIASFSSFPLIIKPDHLGSSIAVSKAENEEELETAIETAFEYDSQVIIEPFLRDMIEINCSAITDNGEVQASQTEQPIYSDTFLSYDEKYKSKSKSGVSGMGSISRKMPADVSKEINMQVKEITKKAYTQIGFTSLVRIDFMLDKTNNKIYLNEINSIPGSLSFYLWEPIGIDFKSLTDKLITSAKNEFRKTQNRKNTINVNLLELSGKGKGKF